MKNKKMKLSVALLDEATWIASAPKKLGLPDIEVDADSTAEAGRVASDEYWKKHGKRGVDPYSIDLKQLEDKAPKSEASIVVFQVERDYYVEERLDGLEELGYTISYGVDCVVVYHPKHWEETKDLSGIMFDDPDYLKLNPKSPEASKFFVMLDAYRDADTGELWYYDFEQCWEDKMPNELTDEIDKVMKSCD
jgi:hypothetical protein